MTRVPGDTELYVGVDQVDGDIVVIVGPAGDYLFRISAVQSALYRAALETAEQILATGVGKL